MDSPLEDTVFDAADGSDFSPDPKVVGDPWSPIFPLSVL